MKINSLIKNSVFLSLGLVVAGCQTISQSNTPYMYQMQQSMLEGVSRYCIVSNQGGAANGGQKVNAGNIVYNLQIAKDMSGWVRAQASNPGKHVEGFFYYNNKINEFRCSGLQVPKGLPTSYRPITEAEASIILNHGELPPSETTPTRLNNNKAKLF